MRDFNKFILVGRFADDPEMRFSPAGLALTNVPLAVSNDKYNQETKEWIDNADFIPITFFGTTAERVAEKMVKGDKVIVEGSIRTHTYEKDGKRIKSYDFHGDNATIVIRKDRARSEGQVEKTVVYESGDDGETPPWEN